MSNKLIIFISMIAAGVILKMLGLIVIAVLIYWLMED